MTPYNGRPPYERIALVLQGGGALGAYQAGVYERLSEAGIEPDWIAGISIGALNAAIIAGNPPAQRVAKLRQFWETICQPAFSMPLADALQEWIGRSSGAVRRSASLFESWRALVEGQSGFFLPRIPPALWPSQPPEMVSFYDTTPLRGTLEQLVDFDRINSGETRVTVSAVEIATGNEVIFDSERQKLGPEHFMASGALPPGFPPVEVEGRLYWDGGLVSNTPLVDVLSATPRQDTLAFQVDLWSARGPLPRNLFEVETRRKDIIFSSRTRFATDTMKLLESQRHQMREILAEVPASRRHLPVWQRIEEMVRPSFFKVIHLIYRGKSFEGISRDYEFSFATMRDHWTSGRDDMSRTLGRAEWFGLDRDGPEYVTHDIHRDHHAPASAELPAKADAA